MSLSPRHRRSVDRSVVQIVFLLVAVTFTIRPAIASEAWHVAGMPVVTTRQITFENAGARLHGTLYLPATHKPVPAIVVFHDASIGTAAAALYRHLRDGLPAIGIAVLLFDRRGSGASTGNANEASYETLADDGVAGSSAIARLPQIDSSRIGYWGMSQGGWLAILAASRDPRAAYVVSVSAPLVTPETQMEFAMANHLHVLGYSPGDVNAMLAARKACSNYMEGNGSRATAVAALEAIESKPWFDLMYLPTASALPRNPASSMWRKHMSYDPLTALESVRVPTLLVFGGADPWIPVANTIDRLRVVARSHPNIDFDVVANASHEMMILPRDQMSTDTKTLQSDAPNAQVYFMLLSSWLARHIR
jgi:dienelactone hydrolase